MKKVTIMTTGLALLFCSMTIFSAQAKDASRKDLNGIWQSEGYGYTVKIKPKSVQVYDATDKTCMKNDDMSKLFTYALKRSKFLDIKLGKDGDTFEVSQDFEPHTTQFQRLSMLPKACLTSPQDNPYGNFDAFVDIFDKHYAFFDLYNIDWEARSTAARTKVTPFTTDEDLFQILSDLIAPLKDGHVEISAVINGDDREFEPYPGKTSDAITAKAERLGQSRKVVSNQTRKAYWGGIKTEILGGQGSMAGKGFIQYGITDGDIGYMAFMTEFGFANRKLMAEKKDLAVLNKTMERALTLFEKKKVKAVIIDLSVNFGGYDFISRAIAGRFAEEKTLAYTKYAGDAGYENPEETRLYVIPAEGKRFTGPVYLLTSDVTVSAGEILTMSLRALPNVTHAGEPTRGALSDVLEKVLPNGWTINLSNEVYTDSAGKAWEGKGIEPEIFLENFDAENPTSTHIDTVDKLIQIIRKPNGAQN